MHVKYCMWHKS